MYYNESDCLFYSNAPYMLVFEKVKYRHICLYYILHFNQIYKYDINFIFNFMFIYYIYIKHIPI